MRNIRIEVYDELAVLAPEVQEELKKTEAYRRFAFERARLEKMVADTLETTGKLSHPGLIKQKNFVYELGRQVLEHAYTMQFMKTEPSYEEFQAMRFNLPSQSQFKSGARRDV